MRKAVDNIATERDKLRNDLSDALSRNAMMAAEVDERHSQLERSFES